MTAPRFFSPEATEEFIKKVSKRKIKVFGNSEKI